MTTLKKGRIFISYRRADSAPWAGRIYDRLAAHFGEGAIFMDVDTIEAGVDFVEVLQKAVQSCDVLVALIGRRWMDIKDETGKRRLDNPEDFVRIEVAAALERDIRVIPVLVDGVPMPRSTELPKNLKPLARRNALQVDHHSFNGDTRRLISQLELALKAAEDSRISKARKIEEEKARQTNLRKERQRESIEGVKKFFSGMGKTPIFIAGGITLLFLLGYIISKIDFPSQPEPTQFSIPTNPFTVTSASPTSTSLPKSTATPTEIPPTPIPEFGVGSTMISEIDGMVMVYVPAGEFQMGSENGGDGEKPVHTVSLDAFWIDQTEVTNQMFAAFLNAEGNQSEGGETWLDADDSDVRIRQEGETWQADSGYEDHPASEVSWYGAKAYCEWAGRRLPTEAEWEKAASWDDEAQSQRVYPWGDSIDCSRANYWGEYGDCVGNTTAVASYESGQSFYGAF